MAQMPTRPCTRCGMSLAANQRFCTNCGATVDVIPGNPLGSTPGSGKILPGPPPMPVPNAQMAQSPQFWGSQQAPSVPGTPSLSQAAPSVSGMPSFSQPVHSPALPPGQSTPLAPIHSPHQMQGQPALPQQAHAPSLHGMQAQSPQAPAFHAPSAPPHVQPASVPG